MQITATLTNGHRTTTVTLSVVVPGFAVKTETPGWGSRHSVHPAADAVELFLLTIDNLLSNHYTIEGEGGSVARRHRLANEAADLVRREDLDTIREQIIADYAEPTAF